MLEENQYPVFQSQMEETIKPAEPQNEEGLIAGKKKKSKLGGKAKSAINGMIFGLCAAIVFCLVSTGLQKTIFKSQLEADAVANIEENQKTQQEEAKIEDASQTEEEAEKVSEDAQSNPVNQITQVSQTQEAMSVSEIAQNAMPSVVSITTKGIEEVRSMFGTRQYESQGAGSGIIVGQNETELLIATNNHVVSGASEVSVCFDDENEDAIVLATVKGTDASKDLAIVSVKLEDIKPEVKGMIRVIKLGDSDSLVVGDQVVAIGNALGYGQSVTTGIVSALNREVDIEQYTANLIQTDAAINPGNSGGALLNMKGELIGINSVKNAANAVEGMGYAIPIATAKPILDSLMNRETRELVSESEAGYLGISCQDVSKEAMQFYDMPMGVYVAEVEEAGAAENAGIRKGDIITKFDGITVENSKQLRDNLAYYKQGETVEVTIMRSNNGEYQEKTVSVTLAKSAAIEKQKLEEAAKDLNPQDGLKLPDDLGKQKEDSKEEAEPQSPYDDGQNQQMPDQMEQWFNYFFGNGGF